MSNPMYGRINIMSDLMYGRINMLANDIGLVYGGNSLESYERSYAMLAVLYRLELI